MTNPLMELTAKYEDKYFGANSQEMTKVSFIRKMPNGRWKVVSQKGKTLGVYLTKEQAVRLRQIEFFKHKKKKASDAKSESIDLTSLKELAYSGVMRELRQQCDDETVREFQMIFKRIFDAIVLNGEENPAEKAMPAAIIMLGKSHEIELNDY